MPKVKVSINREERAEGVLHYLRTYGAINRAYLAVLTQIPISTLEDTLRRMEQEGLIQRRRATPVEAARFGVRGKGSTRVVVFELPPQTAPDAPSAALPPAVPQSISGATPTAILPVGGPTEGWDLEAWQALLAGFGHPGHWWAMDMGRTWSLFRAAHTNDHGLQVLKAPKTGTPYAEYWPTSEEAVYIVTALEAFPYLVAEVERLSRLEAGL